MEEMGMVEFMDEGVDMEEWKEKGEGFLKKEKFEVMMQNEGEGRKIIIKGKKKEMERMESQMEIREFMEKNGRVEDRRRYMKGEEQKSKYEKIKRRNGEEIIMNEKKMNYDKKIREGK